ncbi:hypothetical protein BN1723_005524 [Verticillium longisporum]|uniref:Uncharacterized protein n=1 Tax=Verticillium longisporum TaxID=100787 RepID=A0A0G4N9R4_VERLO|nr:hypothetical protein BN1708_004956 [Verticillium longisporum]CRK43070.1 hypothetical protein BN1723_005524 [Verticillium longisporum]
MSPGWTETMSGATVAHILLWREPAAAPAKACFSQMLRFHRLNRGDLPGSRALIEPLDLWVIHCFDPFVFRKPHDAHLRSLGWMQRPGLKGLALAKSRALRVYALEQAWRMVEGCR